MHGYLDELLAALQDQGLIDAEGNWSAGNARLWFLGDFTDRGPDGIGVIDLVMQLSAEAAAAGGYCKALMGNHELLLLGAKRFGDTPVNSGAGTASFQAAWLLNGGQRTDMERLEDHHLQWMSRLDAMRSRTTGTCCVHSDTTAYLDYGDSHRGGQRHRHRDCSTRSDADECWDLFRKFTKRFAFRDEDAGAAGRPRTARHLRRQPHRPRPQPHPVSARARSAPRTARTAARPPSRARIVYADGLAIAMDGGVTMAGKLLVVQLPAGS